MSINAVRLIWLLALCIPFLGCAQNPADEFLARLSDSNADVRRTALHNFVEHPLNDDRIAAALTKTITDSDADIRYTAIDALGTLGAAAQSSLPAIKPALHDPEESVRLRAAWTIAKIDPHDQSYIPVINAALRAGDGRTLLEVAAVGPNAAWAIPTLTSLLSHPSPKVRTLASQALGAVGPAAATAKSALENAQHDSNPLVQKAAHDALQRISTQPSPEKK